MSAASRSSTRPSRSTRASAPDSATALSGVNVLVAISGFELGGAERQAVLLARELAGRGASVQVWGLFGPGHGPTLALCERYGLRWRAPQLDWDRGLLRDFTTLARLARSLRREKPDVILPYTIYPNVICGSVWRLTGASLCVWNQRDNGLYRMTPGLEKWAVRQTPLFVSNSAHGAAFLEGSLNVAPSRIRIVRNGVELQPAAAGRSEWRSRLGLEADTFVACMVANLHRYKDHATLLRAWRVFLDAAGANAPVLVLAGRRDSAAPAVDELIRRFELGQSVRILGHVDDVTGLLEASDLFILSSCYEGVPNAVLEAMAAGLPVVATDVAGIREAVGDEGVRHLAPPGDHEVLASRILEMAASPDTRVRARERNRRRAEQEFDVPGMVEPMVGEIQSAMRTSAGT